MGLKQHIEGRLRTCVIWCFPYKKLIKSGFEIWLPHNFDTCLRVLHASSCKWTLHLTQNKEEAAKDRAKCKYHLLFVLSCGSSYV